MYRIIFPDRKPLYNHSQKKKINIYSKNKSHSLTHLGMTNLQAEAGMAGGWNKLIERQSEVYVECLAARCQVHYRRSIMQLIRVEWMVVYTVQYVTT